MDGFVSIPLAVGLLGEVSEFSGQAADLRFLCRDDRI